MESALLDALVSGGPIAVLAFIIFLMYRRDARVKEDRLRQDRIFMEERLDKVLSSYAEKMEKNTQVLSELIIWLKARNGGK